MGDNAPSLLSGDIGVLGPRNSCQEHKDFWRLSSRDRRALVGFGTVDTPVSRRGDSVLPMGFGLVRKSASILLSPMLSVVWSEFL